MAIPPEDVAQVRAATDLVVLIGEYTPLKRVGQRSVGLCPFHAEKTPSFSVNGQEGLYYCHGCHAAGDAISFLRAIEGYDFVEAVERLASRAGISVRHEAGAEGQAERREQQALKDAMSKAVAFYHDRLLSNADAAHARAYLRSRGYDGETVREFKLGWAPDRGRELLNALRLPGGTLTKSGLAHQGRYELQDTFRGRVIFPIFDPSGSAIALGGRVLPGDSSAQPGPKYRNSPETPIYSKRRTLYGLNWARQGIVQAGEIVICEGYTDVIGLFTVGVTRAVATCGTALTDEHFRLIARFAKRVVLAFDADAAGQSAASRFYAWEKRDDVEVAVAALPQGSDPGDMANRDPDGLRRAIEESKPFLGFRVDRALVTGNLSSPEGRARAAEAAMAMIAEHPDNELVRDQYLVTIADRTHIEVDRLRDRMERGIRLGGTNGSASSDRATGRRPGEAADGRPAPSGVVAGQRAGLDALSLAVHLPEVMAPRLDEALFADPVQLEAYIALSGSASLHEAIEGADEPVADLLTRLAVSEPEASADHTFVALVRTASLKAMRELESDARTAEESGDAARLGADQAAISWIKPRLEVVQDSGVRETAPAPVIEAADALLGWLSSRRRNGAHE